MLLQTVKKWTLLLFIIALSGTNVSATHVAGADLTYEHVSGNFYRINLTYYRDCSGNMPGNSEIVRVQSVSCSVNFTVQLSLQPGSGSEITFPCSGSGSTCSGGSTFGVQKWTYSNVVQLQAACSDWVFSWQRCCRNCAITTTIHGNCNTDPLSEIYIEATLDNLNFPSNNSPTFSNDPVATMCLAQGFVYNHGVTDVDSDSLAYNIVASKIAPGTSVSYQPGYSALNPINSLPPLTINNSGDLSMTPQQIEIGVMAVKISEYRNGMVIGSVTRDMQFIVQSCTNTLPSASGINGTADFDTTVCPGTPLCFYIFTNEADPGQALTLSVSNAIPGSTFNNSGGPVPTASFCWTPTAADARSTPWTFTVTVKDDACPTNGLQTYSFSITVPEITTATAVDHAAGEIDLTVTGNTGPYSYAWSNGATSEDVSGLSPGIYTVTVCDVNGCCTVAQDTVVLPANCTFNVSRVIKHVKCGNVCSGSIKLTPSGGTPPYSYAWSNGETSNLADSLCGGTYYYTVTDANGCSWQCHTTIVIASILNVSCTGVNACMGACNGEASVLAGGGLPPYSYLWSTGDTTSTVTNLCCGTYTVAVTDANGCVESCQVTISQFQALNLTATVTNGSSVSACDGKLVAHASGGVAGYDFIWSDGSSSSSVSTDSIVSICPGRYMVTVTDANGCTRKAVKNVGPFTSQGCSVNASQNAARMEAEEIALFAPLMLPNPFNNDFTIETGNDDPLQVNIYTISGMVVKSYEQVMPGARIGDGLSAGLYIIEILQNGNVSLQRLSKSE